MVALVNGSDSKRAIAPDASMAAKTFKPEVLALWNDVQVVPVKLLSIRPDVSPVIKVSSSAIPLKIKESKALLKSAEAEVMRLSVMR